MDRHPAAAVIGGLLTLFWMSLILSVYPIAGLTIIAVVAAAAGIHMLGRERRRRQALAARADWEYRAAMARYGQASAGPDTAEQMRRTAWQPDIWSAEQPLSPQLPAAVRPANPAPWHVVTQWPTRKFGSPS